MNQYELHSLRLLARERHDQRLREANEERLARAIRSTWQRRPRQRLTIGFSLRPLRSTGGPRLQA